MSISYRGLGNTNRGKVLWKLACLALMWVVLWEKNARNFEDKVRSSEGLWDMIFFLASFQASCSTFKGAPLNLIQPDWMLVCNSKGVGQQGQIIFVYSHMGHRLWNLIDLQILKLEGSSFLAMYFLEDLSSFFILILLASIYYVVVSHK